MAVEFRLFGDVEVRLGGRPVDVGHDRQRCVLTVLLVEANRPVSVDQVVDRVWGGRGLPHRPAGAVQTYISLLRRTLAPAEVVIARSPGGYRIAVDEEAVDLHRFHHLLDRAREADDEDAAPLLEQALALWRGVPFATLDTPWINAARTVLTGRRHAALLDLADIQLRRGRHAALVPDLSALVDEHPTDERVAGQLMLALYGCGRPADALLHYQRLCRRLADGLGTDPSAPLQELHQRILTADPALAVSSASVVPRQLPAAPRSFTGRTEELVRLDEALGEQTVVLSVIGGVGGVGKTWLALHWAHRHLDRFPDGQLYVNLRGFDPAEAPVRAEAAVRGFLSALGVGPAAIPAEPDAQIGLYRSLVAGKRLLVVLDNARDTAQVLPLLPGGPACTAVITSRRRLDGLVVTHRAHAVDLDPMPDNEAEELLADVAGRDRITAEPGAVAEILACCAGLPLALGIVAVRAATHPRFPLDVLAEELRDASARLDALDTAELTTGVRAVLSWSHRALDAVAATVLELIALAPGPDIGLPAVADLSGLSTAQARAVVRELEDAHLLQQSAPGRYRLHDLIRLYAGEQAHLRLSKGERDAALRRLIGFHLHTADLARLLEPSQTVDLGRPGDGCRPLRFPGTAAAVAWFETEHASLLAVQQLALDHGWHVLAWQLAWALESFQIARGHLHEHVRMWRTALVAAQRLDDAAVHVLCLQRLGLGCSRAGAHAEALAHLRHALAITRRTGDEHGRAHTHRILSKVWEGMGRYRQALAHAASALRLFQTFGDPVLEAMGLNSVGWLRARSGDPHRAHAYCARANLLFRQQNDREGQAATLDSLGYIAHHTGRHEQAVGHYRDAIALCRSMGETHQEAVMLEHLGQAYDALGKLGDARRTWQLALDLYRAQQRSADVHRVEQLLAVSAPAPTAAR